MRYLLLNKDIVWLEFRCERNEYLEVTAQEEVWYTEKRPFGYTNLTDFLERRKAPKHRAHIGGTPKFCVKSNECRNRAKFICRRQRLDRLPSMSTT